MRELKQSGAEVPHDTKITPVMAVDTPNEWAARVTRYTMATVKPARYNNDPRNVTTYQFLILHPGTSSCQQVIPCACKRCGYGLFGRTGSSLTHRAA
mgnify:CR=1 FL=1